jgi:hypothetical protein
VQWRQVSLTELRAAIAELNSNRCAGVAAATTR